MMTMPTPWLLVLVSVSVSLSLAPGRAASDEMEGNTAV